MGQLPDARASTGPQATGEAFGDEGGHDDRDDTRRRSSSPPRSPRRTRPSSCPRSSPSGRRTCSTRPASPPVSGCSTWPVARASSPAPRLTGSVWHRRRFGRRGRPQRGDARRGPADPAGSAVAAGRRGRDAVRRRGVRRGGLPDGDDVPSGPGRGAAGDAPGGPSHRAPSRCSSRGRCPRTGRTSCSSTS